MISVLVPTRERIDRLHVMLTTLYATAADPARVEVIARCDTDDLPTITYLRDQGVAAVCKPRIGYAGNARMVNECASLAEGDLLLVANDDLEFQTPGWDLCLAAAAARYPDGIVSLGVDTVLNNENFCFPCLPRRLMDILGCVFDDRLLYPDIWLRDVLQRFGRAVRVPEVVIKHAWTGQTEDQAREARRIHTDPAYAGLYARCVADGQARIRAVLPC